jgi:Tfp pilus assembly protein PilF
VAAPTAVPDPIPELDEALLAPTADALVAGVDRLTSQYSLAAAAHYLDRGLARFPADARVVVRLLEILLRWRDYDRFEEVLSAALARFGGRADLHALAGRAHAECDEHCAAIRAYGRAARLDPDDVESIQRVARLFRKRGRPFLARRFVRRHLRRHPDVAALHATMGFAYVDDEQFPKAVAAFKAAVDLEPDDSPFLNDWGGALLLAERWREAAVVAVRSLKARAANERAWTVFAVAHRHMGDLDRAERGYRKAVEHAKDTARAKGNLGLFLAAQKGRPERAAEAREFLRSALVEHPDWTEVENAYEALRRAPTR